MLNTERTLRDFVFLVYQLAVNDNDQLPPTPWTDIKITPAKYAVLLRQGWQRAQKGRMQMCLRFDLPDGSVAYLGNGDPQGHNNDIWHGRIEGPIAESLGCRWIEFGVMADAEVDTKGLLAATKRSRPFELRPRS
ncbi:MAG: hypothetical protein ABIH67_04770 [Candidatus Uhrbacteria bacterium]